MGQSAGYYIGVDLGATKILAAALGFPKENGKPDIFASAKVKTPRAGKAEELVAAIVEAVGAVNAESGASGAPLLGLGVAVPGPLDRARGIVRYTPNLGLKEYPLSQKLSERFGIPVVLENDVQAGVYGELKAGALRGKRHAVGVFIGTGVGGGIVMDGKLYRGSTGSAGEVGHMILHEGGALCGCGNYGCLEALASRTALAKDSIALAASGKAPVLLEAAGTDFKKYRSSAFEASLEGGDEAVARAVDRSAFWLGVGLANIVNLLNPEAIVLGGGVVARFGRRYRDEAVSAMRERLMPGLASTVEVLEAELGDLSVAAGAALISAFGEDGQEGAPSRANGKKGRKRP